jgi:amidase
MQPMNNRERFRATVNFESFDHLPPELGLEPKQLNATYGRFTIPWNFSGQPALSLPIHVSSSGLPVGVQLVAAYGRDDLLIRIAAQLERLHPWPG